MAEPIAYNYQGAAEAVGLSVDTIKAEVAADNIPTRYYGRKPLIPAESLAAWFKSLPAERPKPAERPMRA